MTETSSVEPTLKRRPNWVHWLWLLALLAVPVVLWVLPADHFDEGQSMCPSVVLFDTECFGCGSTRAVQHLHHAELADALYFHQAAPLIYAGLVLLWFVWTYRTSARLGIWGETTRARVEGKLRAAAARKAAKRQDRSC